jgi:hypothetical protein
MLVTIANAPIASKDEFTKFQYEFFICRKQAENR